MENNPCADIIDKYYRIIYAYCFSQLNFSKFAADDCTQEVFLIMIKKQKKLDFSDNIKLWLYRTADNVIRSYRRKNFREADVDIDELTIAVENDFEIKADSSAEILDRLSEDEKNLIEAYYSSDYGGKEKVAEHFGITLSQLYKRIHKIKQKLRE